MNITSNNTPTRQAVMNGLAVVGFIALVVLGMWLAVYSTRYVPTVANHVGSAAVYLGSVFNKAPAPGLTVVPTASTTISFGNASTTGTKATSTVATTPKPNQTTTGIKTSGTYQIGGTSNPTLSGLPDLIVTIKAVGYLATSSADSFVASSTVPSGSRPAVNFTIKNIGTNIATTWRFSVSIPTQTSYLFQSQYQQSLNPGDSIDYVLGFDQANRGSGQMISVTANFDRTVAESNTHNNYASTSITILGS